MTILEAISTLNAFPIPSIAIEKICIDRGLDAEAEYTNSIGISQAFELASADYFLLVHDSPSLTEQNISISNLVETKRNLMNRANQIYSKYGDSKFSGRVYGFIGENYNG